MKKIIIIGSGIGGLVAGNLLATKGHAVTIFESHSSPGGYTAGFYRKGFYFESGTLSFECLASVAKVMKDIGISDKVTFVRQKCRLLSEDFDIRAESYKDVKDGFYRAFPGEKRQLDHYFKIVGDMISALGDMRAPMPYFYDGFQRFFSVAGFLPSIGKYRGLERKYAKMTVGELTGSLFACGSKAGRYLKKVGYPEMSALLLGGFLASVFEDYYTVKEGMQAWADALADNFKKVGGELRLNSYVSTINVKKGAAAGVRCGESDYDADYVIAAGDYKKTFLKLLDTETLISDGFRRKIEESPVSEGFFAAYAGLSIDNEELKKYMRAPHVFYIDNEADARAEDPADAEHFKKCSLFFYSPSLVNEKHAPAGRSSLMIQAICPRQWMNNWGNGDRAQYSLLKLKVQETLIARASGILSPEIKERIEYQDSATPLTYERYTHNTEGATAGWSWSTQGIFFDSLYDIRIETPVKNLLIGSSWVGRIGGIPYAMAAAYECAREINRR